MKRPDLRGGTEQPGHMRGSPWHGLSEVMLVELMLVNHFLVGKAKGHPVSQLEVVEPIG